MYETLGKLWKDYGNKYSTQWDGNDPRHGLSAEVGERLTQLDLILDHLKVALAAVAIDPKRLKHDVEWMTKAQPLFARGEMTKEEYSAGFSPPPEVDGRRYVRAWNEVRLFTEMFYFVAWRLLQVLNMRKPVAFPNLPKIKATGIRNVRNLLIEHPEDAKAAANYQQSLIVTDDGPVLKTMEVLIGGSPRRVSATSESVDRGLYVNAEKLRGEIEECLREALESGN